jgi:deoxycytidylate deaminase
MLRNILKSIIKDRMNFDRVIQAYIDEAFELNKSNKSCHLALLLQGHKVISYGFNQMDRQCFRGKTISSLHAEIDCLRKCRPIKDLIRRNYTLVIVKVAKEVDKLYSDSSPCKCCTKFIKGLGFKHVYCTTKEGKIEKINLDEYVPYTRAPSQPRRKR